MIDLQSPADEFAAALGAADARRPVAINQRTKQPFQPGIGPHSEAQAVRLAVAEMQAAQPNRYRDVSFDIPYPDKPRQKCDLSIADDGDTLFVESKLLRILGDNGKPNDNMLMHILSPYPQHRSALTDCQKLRQSGFDGRKAVLIFGYEGAGWPLEPAIDAFEVIAARHGSLGPRCSAAYNGLCHPVHRAGAVYLWEVLYANRNNIDAQS